MCITAIRLVGFAPPVLVAGVPVVSLVVAGTALPDQPTKGLILII